MLYNRALFVLTFIYFSTICEAETPVRKCSGDHPLPLYVQVEDCEELPCVVTRGTIASMDLQFVATKDDTYHIGAYVRATVLGITVPYPLPNDSGNVCKNLLYGAYCPLYKGEDVTYHIDLPVENTFPEVNVRCEVKLVDTEGDIVSCFVTDLKVRK